MTSFVDVDGILLTKPFTAVRALVRFFSGVGSHVSFEGILEGERLGAVGALHLGDYAVFTALSRPLGPNMRTKSLAPRHFI